MIVVTGAAGFIGCNVIRRLNAAGHTDVIAVDDLSDGAKFSNLLDCHFSDYLDKDEFIATFMGESKFLKDIKTIFHQGACSDTTQWDGKFMLDNNYRYSKHLLDVCIDRRIPFIYASSAAVYGEGNAFKACAENEKPVNVYAFSKLLFDRYVRKRLGEGGVQIAGLRYFNVYGPYEAHKRKMASMAYQLNQQLLSNGVINLFKGSGGYADGEQRRDFIHVDDVVAVNLWLMENPRVCGIFNVGTGKSRSFNALANGIMDWHKKGTINYIDFPDGLSSRYQSFTEADLSALREAGYQQQFMELEEGIETYLNWLNQ